MRLIERIKRHKAVDQVIDERASGDGIWAELKPGYIDSSSGCHAIHEDTFTEIINKLPCIEPCSCSECAA